MAAAPTSNLKGLPVFPGLNDVLCGDGKAVRNHIGNQHFRALVKDRAQSYANIHSHADPESSQSPIAEAIVYEIEVNGGRFLKKRSDGAWIVLSRHEAVEKARQALRDARRLLVDRIPVDMKVLFNDLRVDDDPMQSLTNSIEGSSIATSVVSDDEDPCDKPSLGDISPIKMSSLLVSSTKGTTTGTPDKLDVLCGSGKAIKNHPGNIEFRRVVKAMMTALSIVPTMKTTQVSESVVQHFEARGGRFLKQNTEGVWCPIPHSEAVEKTLRALRDAKQFTTLPPQESDPSHGYVSMVDHSDMLPSPVISLTNGTTPDKLDVLCGGGKAMMNHPGNVEFRRLVKYMVTSFSDAPGHMKTQISESIVQNIEARGGRFLKQNTEGVWCPIPHSEAVAKTTRALRDAKNFAHRHKRADHSPDSSPKQDRKISAPMPVAPTISPPFEPSFDDRSPLGRTLSISGNTGSVVETFDTMNLDEQSPLDKTKPPPATEVLEGYTQPQTMSIDETRLQSDDQHPTPSKRPQRTSNATGQQQQQQQLSKLRQDVPTSSRDLVSGSNIEMTSYSQSETLRRGYGYPDLFDTNEQLGSGVQGNVFECTSKENGRTFAVKIINTDRLTQEKITRLQTELQLLNQINGEAHLLSPKIVHVFHTYESPDYTHIVMEQILGGTLTDWLYPPGYFRESDTRTISRNLFEALHYCHQRGIAHRDIKLGNLVFAKPNDLTSLKITNFGFAKKVPRNGLTTRCGTPLFVSPEIVLLSDLYKSYDTKCDMWSAGVVVYFLLVGIPPFWFVPEIGESIQDLYQTIVLGNFDIDHGKRDMVSNEAITLIKGLLTKDPRTRWSAQDVLECQWMKIEETSLSTIPLRFTSLAIDETSCSCLPRFNDNTGSKGNEELPARSIFSCILDPSRVKLFDRFVID